MLSENLQRPHIEAVGTASPHKIFYWPTQHLDPVKAL